MLRHLEDWSGPEIAAALGLSPGTVKRHLFRAVHRLRVESGGHAMSRCLTERRLVHLQAGLGDPREQAHVEACPACADDSTRSPAISTW